MKFLNLKSIGIFLAAGLIAQSLCGYAYPRLNDLGDPPKKLTLDVNVNHEDKNFFKSGYISLENGDPREKLIILDSGIIKTVLTVTGLCGYVSCPYTNTVYPISKFSKDYYAIVTEIGNENNRFSSGYTTVYDKFGRQIIRVNSSFPLIRDTEGNAPVNSKVITYSEQNALIYEDFNFDGIKDFALQSGKFSCYGGSSFKIYLAKSNGGFEFNEAFTRLATYFCGMFEVDNENQKILAFTKSSCCWHEFSTFYVRYEQPILERSEVRNFFLDYYRYKVTDHRINFSEVKFYLPVKGETNDYGIISNEFLLSFNLQENPNKKVITYKDSRGLTKNIEYAFLKGKDNEVEFSAILAANKQLQWQKDFSKKDIFEYKRPMFQYKAPGMLSFNNGDVKYTIIDEPDRVGVEVKEPDRVTFIPGDIASRKGSIRNLKIGDFENVRQ